MEQAFVDHATSVPFPRLTQGTKLVGVVRDGAGIIGPMSPSGVIEKHRASME
jgi:hypothetical protein